MESTTEASNIVAVTSWCPKCDKWHRYSCESGLKTCPTCGTGLQHEIFLSSVSPDEIEHMFGKQFSRYMKHSGLVLYLIFNPQVVEMLSGVKAKALELCLPPANWARIILPGRRGFRTIDLVFEKQAQNRKNYYLVDVKSAKPYRGDFDKMREYIDDFRGCLGSPEWLKHIEIFPIIVYPAELIIKKRQID